VFVSRGFNRWKHCAGRIALAVWLLICITGSTHAQARLDPDAGKFLIQIQETNFGVNAFTARSDGGSESDIAYVLAGIKSTLHISVHANGGPLRAMEAVSDPGGRLVLTVDGSVARLGTGETKQKELVTKDVTVPKHLFPYCTIAPEQLRLVLAAYDLRQGGTQSFDVAYSNALDRAGLMQGKLAITAAGAKPMVVGGVTMPIVRYKLRAPSPGGDLDADLYTDSASRILLFGIPLQKLVVVRDGWQDLAKPEISSDSVLSGPKFTAKVEKSVRVRLRDGITLAADVYRPDAPGRFPVILERTCYGGGMPSRRPSTRGAGMCS
jgi:hypothetical protein